MNTANNLQELYQDYNTIPDYDVEADILTSEISLSGDEHDEIDLGVNFCF